MIKLEALQDGIKYCISKYNFCYFLVDSCQITQNLNCGVNCFGAALRHEPQRFVGDLLNESSIILRITLNKLYLSKVANQRFQRLICEHEFRCGAEIFAQWLEEAFYFVLLLFTVVSGNSLQQPERSEFNGDCLLVCSHRLSQYLNNSLVRNRKTLVKLPHKKD